MAGLFLALAGPSAGAAAEAASPGATVTVRYVVPSLTEPAVTGFDLPHRIYLVERGALPDPATTPPLRAELLLWLPGTAPSLAGPPPDPTKSREGAEAFCQLAARLGYRVISLRYPNSLSASAARRDEAGEFERFRLAVIAGGQSRHISVARSDSIEHRLIKLLQHLAAQHAKEGWQRHLRDDGSIRWETIAVAGQSQGGGHAALIASRYLVARVVCTGAPKDFNVRLNAPAAWLSAPSVTPRSRYFAFNHRQDRQAATWAEQLENLRAMKLDALGEPVDVDTSIPPYRHARILTTDYPGGKLESTVAHTAVISWRNAGVFERVWHYMLTEPVE